MKLSFTKRGWEDYLNLQTEKQLLKKVNTLIRDCLRTPFTGLGKPEPLKNELTGFWSRRIDQEHRLVYAVEANEIVIVSCLHHYS